jgi:hypothetical protein
MKDGIGTLPEELLLDQEIPISSDIIVGEIKRNGAGECKSWERKSLWMHSRNIRMQRN